MCLGVPAKITAVGADCHHLASADVSGVTVKINVSLVCEGEVQSLIGRWVLVHVGFAMSLLDEQEALDTLAALKQMQGISQSRRSEESDLTP
ncbi:MULTISPECIES: HypC/HybG/HupF family hydrogenase formation chaperone [Enterobacterales]|uniref:HypC/HybG/HupF family hydrogenase formation chaperone n=1 Tax=Enterobacterales TaxID=91347 RepID=UPI002ED96E8E